MGERKVLNKYYPPDIDFWKPPKLELGRDRQYVVRLMIPFTLRCITCGNHIYKGKKFNARKETVLNEKYLGMPIFRFYVRCPDCLSEITFKTDPESTDYIAEHGAYRTFQAQNIAVKAAEDKQKDKEEEEANNPMLALENRTKESRREMDILDVLEEIRDVNAHNEGVSFEQLIDKHLEREKKEMEEDEQIDDALAKAAFERARQKLKRLKDDEIDHEEISIKKPKSADDSNHSNSISSSNTGSMKKKLGGLVKRKHKKETTAGPSSGNTENHTNTHSTTTSANTVPQPTTSTNTVPQPTTTNTVPQLTTSTTTTTNTVPQPSINNSTNSTSTVGLTLLSAYSDDSSSD